jgi:tetratricopeptide (TPR) repeat protein
VIRAIGMSTAHIYLGPLAKGLAWADRGLAACDKDPELGAALIGYSPLAMTRYLRAALLIRMGRLAEARVDAEQSLVLGRSRSEPEIVAWSLAILAHVACLTDDGDPVASAKEAVSLAEETGNVSSLVIGLEALATATLTVGGRPDEAVVACQRALAEARNQHSGLFLEASLLASLAQAHLAANQPARARLAADEAVAVARRRGAHVAEGPALLTSAQARRAMGEPNDAVADDLAAALVLVHQTGALTYEPFIREELARLHCDEHQFQEALRLFTAIGARGHAQRLSAELAGSSG